MNRRSNRAPQLLAAMRAWQAEHVTPASYQDLMDMTGITSRSMVSYYLNQLEAQGLIVRERSLARGAVAVPEGRIHRKRRSNPLNRLGWDYLQLKGWVK